MVNSDPAQMSAVMLQWMQTLEWRSVTAVEYRIANNSIVCITACSGWQQRKIRAPQYWLFLEKSARVVTTGFPQKNGQNAEFFFQCHDVIRKTMNVRYLLHVPAPGDDVIKWKHFPRYWPFVRGIHRLPVNSPHKGQWRRSLMFSWSTPE